MARKRPAADEPTRMRVHVAIDSELRRRLAAYAGAHRITEARVIERALSAELAGFYFGQREPRADVTVRDAGGGEPPAVLAIRTG